MWADVSLALLTRCVRRRATLRFGSRSSMRSIAQCLNPCHLNSSSFLVVRSA